jgi:ADP-ribosylglycohydrolase
MADWSAFDEAYLERVYAGLLGKITGVYLGRPVEGWSREHIVAAFGEVDHYIADAVGVPLVVTDDDIAGTVTFLRALADHGFPTRLTATEVGQTWVDRLVEGSSVLWWGGRGISTEHTAYLNLAAGIPAPESGSAGRNGVVAAEQIGAQIFVEGWAMICPGDPAGAAELAGVAARVSHDGVAVDAARLVAAMESAAFDNSARDLTDVVEIIETALAFVARGGAVELLARSVLASRGEVPDWRAARVLLDRDWGYHRYGGDCPVLPNLGVVLLALLWGELDLRRSLMIAATCGWDTDCNAGTVGALVALARGLDAFAPGAGRTDWRSPIADRMLVSTSNGGGAFTDAVREARAVVDTARGWRGLGPLRPAGSPRYDFALPGSVQGFRSPDLGTVVENVPVVGGRALRVRAAAEVAEALTDVFITGEDLGERNYVLLASPALYPGQFLRATVEAPPVTDVQLVVRFWGADDTLDELVGPAQPGGVGPMTLDFEIPDIGGLPINGVGVRARSPAGKVEVLLHDLTWSGPARAVLAPRVGTPAALSRRWREAWLHALDHPAPEPFGDTVPQFTLTQDRGRGFVSTGCDDWTDLRFTATLRTFGAREFGIAVRVAGLRRYVALLVARDGTARLVRRHHDDQTVLARSVGPVVTPGAEVRAELVVEVREDRVRAWVDRTPVADLAVRDLPAGAVALVVDEGTVTVDAVEVGPVEVGAGRG